VQSRKWRNVYEKASGSCSSRVLLSYWQARAQPRYESEAAVNCAFKRFAGVAGDGRESTDIQTRCAGMQGAGQARGSLSGRAVRDARYYEIAGQLG
jgi:hypothetical protein